LLNRELNEFVEKMKGEERRLRRYTQKQAIVEFYRAMYSLRQVLRSTIDVSNVRYDVHLRNFGGEFDLAL